MPGFAGIAPLGPDGLIDCNAMLNKPGICRCSDGTDIRVVADTYRMLNHIGADPGYIGQQVGNSNTKTAAYVTGYMTADPWPAIKTADEIRSEDKTTGIKETSPQGQTCTSLSQGKITVNSKNYVFLNPIPKVKSDNSKLSSNVAVKAPCTNFREVLNDGSILKDSVDLFGTFELTCKQGKITIVVLIQS